MRSAVMMALVVLATVASAEFGDLESRVYKPLAPSLDVTVGGGVAGEIATVPETWPIIPGRRVFVDGLYIDGKFALGGSISRRKATEDDGWRLWGAAWRETGMKWSAGIAYGMPLNWRF